MGADDDLDRRELERIRRSEREASARERALLRPGMGKVFKQIQDAQRKAADATDATEPKRKPKTSRKRGPS